MLWTLERSLSTGFAAPSWKVAWMVPSFVVPYRAVRECSTASRRPTSSPWPAGARPRVGAAGRSVSWRTDWSNSATSPRSPMRPSVARSKKRAEAVAGQDVVHPAPGQRRVRVEDGGRPSGLQTAVRSASTRRLHGRDEQATHRGDAAPCGCGTGPAAPRGLRIRAQGGGGPLPVLRAAARLAARVDRAAASQGRMGVVRPATPGGALSSGGAPGPGLRQPEYPHGWGPVRGVSRRGGEAVVGATGGSLHPQARQLVEHGGDGAERPFRSMPRPAYR